MNDFTLILRGGLVGLSVTAPVGPMGVLCISRTLTQGITRGLATGAGATTVQAGYTLILLLCLHQVEPWLNTNGFLLSLGSALMMTTLAIRLLRQPGQQSGRRAASSSLVEAYLSALAVNLLNPVLLVMLLGAVTLVFGADPPDPPDSTFLVLGVCIGSTAWWMVLSAATALLRTRLNAAVLQTLNRATAALLITFSLAALARAMPG